VKSIIIYQHATLCNFIISALVFEKLRNNFHDHRAQFFIKQTSDNIQKEKVSHYSDDSLSKPLADLLLRHSVDCSPCYNFDYYLNVHNRCMVELPAVKVLQKYFVVLGD
jgi:hypothetical protein